MFASFLLFVLFLLAGAVLIPLPWHITQSGYTAPRREESAVWCCQRGDFTPSLTTRHRFSNYLPSAPCFVAQQCGRARVFSASVTTTFVTCPFPQQTIIKSTPTRRNFKSLISPSSSWTACYFSNKRTSLFHFNILCGTSRKKKRWDIPPLARLIFLFSYSLGKHIMQFFRRHSCCSSQRFRNKKRRMNENAKLYEFNNLPSK